MAKDHPIKGGEGDHDDQWRLGGVVMLKVKRASCTAHRNFGK